MSFEKRRKVGTYFKYWSSRAAFQMCSIHKRKKYELVND